MEDNDSNSSSQKGTVQTDAIPLSDALRSPAINVQLAPTLHNDLYYNMNHLRRGIAVIFNHQTFDDMNVPEREGTIKDCEELHKILRRLGFKVDIFTDLKCSEIMATLKGVALQDHTQHDCLVIVVLSHGKHGKLEAYDTSYDPVSLWSYFVANKCPTLSGKPKLFFTQSCLGNREDKGVCIEQDPSVRSDLLQSDHTFRIPIHADFLHVFATSPGYYAYRHNTEGSWFIQALCKELQENGFVYDLLTLLTLVCKRVATEYEHKGLKQMPCFTSMLTRFLKFTPKNNTGEVSFYPS